MRPFFRYYGSKWNLAKHYGQPRRDLVIEPFAGSACYSLYWNCPRVQLYDIDDEVYQLWDYLINCSEADINALPDRIENINEVLERPYPEERLLLRWMYMCVPKNTPRDTDLAFYKRSREVHSGYWQSRHKQLLLRQKPLIANWTIDKCSYEDIPNCNAHWHIDPPYDSEAGRRYKHSDIDYQHLAEWCRTRQGVVDVCEMDGADWMNFKPFRQTINAGKRQYQEVYWSSDNSGRLI